MSYDQFIAGELSSLNDDRSKIDYDFGDHTRYFASLLNPFSDSSKYSREGMLKEAQTTAEKAINRSSARDRTYIEQGLGGTKVDLSGLRIGKNETQEAYDQRIEALKGKATAATKYAGTEGADLSKITDATSIQQINQLNTQQGKTNRDEQTRKQQEREDDLTTRANDRADRLLKETQLREDRKDIRQDRRLAQERLLAAETNKMNLQLQYAQLAQSERVRAQDRKDRAIMTLISGLGNLGAAFAI